MQPRRLSDAPLGCSCQRPRYGLAGYPKTRSLASISARVSNPSYGRMTAMIRRWFVTGICNAVLRKC